jgi:hypothetical protein
LIEDIDDHGNLPRCRIPVASGVYLYRIVAEDKTATKKMTLLR